MEEEESEIVEVKKRGRGLKRKGEYNNVRFPLFSYLCGLFSLINSVVCFYEPRILVLLVKSIIFHICGTKSVEHHFGPS